MLPEMTAPSRRKLVSGVSEWALPLDLIDGNARLAQNRSPAHVALLAERLWERGLPGDARAVELVLAANASVARPAYLQGPPGVTLHPWVDERAMPEALTLLRDEYWNAGRSTDEGIARAHRASAAWVAARETSGAMIATGRAVTEGVQFGYLADVAVRSDWRGRGVGAAVVRLLLAHPALRQAARVELGTRDAMAFYEALGFRTVGEERVGTQVRRTMARVRSAQCAQPEQGEEPAQVTKPSSVTPE